MLPPVLERLPQVEVVRCYFEPDGSFPHHEPNPLLPENREFIVAKTLAEDADFGVAYDGDADRCFFVDDTGEFVPGDFTTALFAESMLAEEPGGKVIYDVRASWAVPEAIERGRRRWRSSTASGTRSSSSGCARSTRSSPARCPPTTTSATSPRPTPASCPFLLMLELRLEARRKQLRRSWPTLRSQYFLTRRDQHAGPRRGAKIAGDQAALRPAGPRLATSTGSRSRRTTGT